MTTRCSRVPKLDDPNWCDCHGYHPCTAKPLSRDWKPVTTEDTKNKIHRLAMIQSILDDVQVEVTKAIHKYPPMNSAHEGWAVLFEEVDELWEEVRAKQGERDLGAMRTECIQVAAMAVRFAMDICNAEKVQK